ncbi:hypothetical protein DRE_01522 [Drechslerella stenobrocha 248]|uniref:Peptidase S8/S53 domain-containing protein n=1 Tax=Drechslerella stenobrocha 248 TaxID=1043628 RepID=W7I4H6_9PEZI|nr:hypothetical protein DRE_01522 [Drechslerella stenobrocha 248]
MKSSIIATRALLIAALQCAFAAPTPSSSDQAVSALDHAAGTDEYIVLMAPDEKRPWAEIFSSMNCSQSDARTFGTQLRAFTMSMKESDAATISAFGNVAITAKNFRRATAVMPAKPWDMPAGSGFKMGVQRRQAAAVVEQSSATWGLSRISSTEPIQVFVGQAVTDSSFKYRFDRSGGAGVDVYVLDTGLNVAHVDFGGRAKILFSAFGDDGRDTDGHGTHTAGTIGSLTFGVAKNTNLFGVKVIDTEGGSDATIAAGIDASIAQHMQRKNLPGFMGSVISMSLGGPVGSPVFAEVIRRATDAGMHVSVASGNENQDACASEPGRLSKVLPIINVGATDINDARAEFSNFGSCVDIHAPGVKVVSTWNTGPRAVMPLDGTSMACPGVTGVIAAELTKNPNLKLDPAGMKKLILSKAVNGTIRGVANLPQDGMVMLHNAAGEPGASPNATDPLLRRRV